MIYVVFAGLSGVGLLLSMACHIMGWLEIEPPGGKAAFLLHLGIFVVFVPLVFLSNRSQQAGKRNSLDHLLKDLPSWTGWVMKGFFIYALCHFALFIYLTSSYPKGSVPLYLEIRGFSGHWMLFYSWSMIGFMGLYKKSKCIPRGLM